MRLTTLGTPLLLVGLVQASLASTITNGTFNITGIVVFTVPEAGGVVTPAGTCPANTACILWENPTETLQDEVDISASGLPNGDIPAAIAGTDAANIGNLTNPPDIVGGAGFAPATFMTFNNDGITTQLLIDFIRPGLFSSTECSAAPAVGQTCTPVGSPISFLNNPPPPGLAQALWELEGVTNTGGISWIGDFDAPLGTPYQTVLADEASTGFVLENFSATITLTGTPTTTTVPEPGSMGLTMISVGLIACFMRRRPAKSSRKPGTDTSVPPFPGPRRST